MIVTGASRRRVPAAFEPVIDAVVDRIRAADPGAVVAAYGSVVTGQARAGRSDVDVLTIGLDADVARRLGTELSSEFAHLCRGVEIAAAMPADLVGEHDEAYGFRVFLRHYCVPLFGSVEMWPTESFLADERAARGFNGDIAIHAQRWRDASSGGVDAAELATRTARKSLLAIAGLVSVHDRTWTTDRDHAARRWSEIEPRHADDLAVLRRWVDGAPDADHAAIDRILATTVASIVDRFAERIGLWSDPV